MFQVRGGRLTEFAVYLLPIVAAQLVKHGQLDYLVSDYLSEITMSLLTAAKSKRPVSVWSCTVSVRSMFTPLPSPV